MPDGIVCLEGSKRLKMLKRHLRTAYGLMPEQHRTRWKLPAGYPMVAPNYARRRAEFAKRIGLGHASPTKAPHNCWAADAVTQERPGGRDRPPGPNSVE